MKRLKRILAEAVLAGIVFPSCALAGPCDSIDRTFDPRWGRATTKSISWQLGVKSVYIMDAMRKGTWSVIHVSFGDADEVYMFFDGNPAKARHVLLWEGVAETDERDGIYAWIRRNAAGIPSELAECFSWYVAVNPETLKLPRD